MSEEIREVVKVDPYHFPVGDREVNLITLGRSQARQVANLGRWLSKHGQRIMEVVATRPDDETGFGGISFIGEILGGLSEDALCDLFEIVLGVNSEFTDQYFDLMVLVEAAIVVYEQHPTVRKLIDRFFSTPSLPSTPQDSSTPSEVPTDGPTMTS